jgi:rRNA maturation endonuclease Nob1
MVYCTVCGEKTPEGHDFCFKCGARLLKDEVREIEKAPPPSNPFQNGF